QLGSQLTAERVRALKRIIPKAEVQAVLKATGQHRRRCPRLPPWFLVWFAIALGLFCRDCYRQVFQWLQPFRRGGTPRRSTLCEARHRLGVAPLRLLAQRVVRCLATPQTPGAFYRGLRLMALDSFVLNIPDTPANARVFGRPGSSRAPGAFPQVRVLALCETGTHILYRTLLKPCHRGEVSMAAYLLRFLLEDMLLLWDRNFLSYALVRQVRQRRAHLLARVKNNLIFSPCVAWAMVRTWPSCIPRPSTAATTRAASWCGSSSTPSTTQGGRARGRSIAC
ncbi:MAG: transposase domain-containing protein, partial [Planctomycetes bacterium]|nr:transposase domain-containing protein [Planctomycetota bacterium]